MYQAVICTVKTGRVQRKTFDNWEKAWKYADSWSAKNKTHRTYAVSVERVEQTVIWKKSERSIGL